MRTTKALLAAALAIAAVLTSAAPGGAPMGPPTTTLEEGQWAFGGAFGLEKMDMEASGAFTQQFAAGPPITIHQLFAVEDFESTMAFGNLAYGVCDDWNVFVRLGAADSQGDIVIRSNSSNLVESQDSFDGGYAFAWGVGTRATFCRSGPWSFGGLVQVTWFNPGESDFTVLDPSPPPLDLVGGVEREDWQTQVSLAGGYQADTRQCWVGPFLQFIEGDMDFDGNVVDTGVVIGTTSWTTDLEESSQFGLHAGVAWELVERANLWVEGQVTSDSWLLGVGLVFSTQETFGK